MSSCRTCSVFFTKRVVVGWIERLSSCLQHASMALVWCSIAFPCPVIIANNGRLCSLGEVLRSIIYALCINPYNTHIICVWHLCTSGIQLKHCLLSNGGGGGWRREKKIVYWSLGETASSVTSLVLYTYSSCGEMYMYMLLLVHLPSAFGICEKRETMEG